MDFPEALRNARAGRPAKRPHWFSGQWVLVPEPGSPLVMLRPDQEGDEPGRPIVTDRALSDAVEWSAQSDDLMASDWTVNGSPGIDLDVDGRGRAWTDGDVDFPLALSMIMSGSTMRRRAWGDGRRVRLVGEYPKRTIIVEDREFIGAWTGASDDLLARDWIAA